MKSYNNIISIFKVREACPVCENSNLATYWHEDHSDDEDYYFDVPMHRIGQPNGFYLCRHCGYFIREYDCTCPNEGIVFDPKKIPFKRQLMALRANYKKVVKLDLQIKDLAYYKYEEEIPAME